MSSPTLPVQRVAAPGLLDRLAWRVALAAAERIRIGRLRVVFPDGSARPSAATRPRAAQRSGSTTGRPSPASSAAVRPAPARPTWTACGPARTCRRCCGSPRGTARPCPLWRLVPRPGPARPHGRPSGSPQHAVGQPAQHRRPLRPRQRPLPAVPRRDDDVLERGLRIRRTSRSPTRSGTSTGASRPTRGLRAGQHVLEIGTGWGGFALYAAGELGCRVTTITISKEQYDLAPSRVHDAGLDHLVDVQLRDYRDIEGTYDAIVSIEMLEAVGAEYHATFFETCDRALRPGGRLSLQVITFPDAAYERQLRGANWIQTYIFPGGLCPSLAVIERATRDTSLLIGGVTTSRPTTCGRSRVADGVPRQARRGPRARVRRAVHPDVGLLPGPE